MNANDSRNLYGLTIEPADQGVCAGNGFVVEANNLGEMLVFNTGLHRISAPISLDSVMGLPSIPASMGGPWSSGGDVSCLYDYNNGGHWFITEFVSNSSWAVGGPFGGCFAGKAFGCFEGIAVSVTNDPLGSYNVYFLNANYDSSEPGYPSLLNDFAKIATTRDAFLLFYDEFPLVTAGIGGGGFNGAQEFAITKKALELGFPVTTSSGEPNPHFNVAIENMGFLATPDGTCADVGACWYQVIPAHSPDPTQFDNRHGGSGYLIGPLDFFGAGDTRIAVFDWTGLSSLLSSNCATCSEILFGSQLFSGLEGYFNPGFTVPQKSGPIPLGDSCVAHHLNASNPHGDDTVTSCPEGGINSNGDGFTQATYAQGQIWGAISTVVTQTYAKGTGCPCSEFHMGVDYFVFGTGAGRSDDSMRSHSDESGGFSLTNQGIVTAAHEELTFPAIAAGGARGQDGGNGGAILTFTLSGNGGPTHADRGGYFPSTAYGRLTSISNGLLGHVINIADKGKAPQDGFTEYRGYPDGTGPRWGDYSAAVFLPFSGGRIYFSTGYIQSPNCDAATFAVDPSCDGTRTLSANWGTSVNFVVP